MVTLFYETVGDLFRNWNKISAQLEGLSFARAIPKDHFGVDDMVHLARRFWPIASGDERAKFFLDPKDLATNPYTSKPTLLQQAEDLHLLGYWVTLHSYTKIGSRPALRPLALDVLAQFHEAAALKTVPANVLTAAVGYDVCHETTTPSKNAASHVPNEAKKGFYTTLYLDNEQTPAFASITRLFAGPLPEQLPLRLVTANGRGYAHPTQKLSSRNIAIISIP